MISSYIKHHIFGLLLIFIYLLIILANWTPGTFLSGWDTLHPEFNFHLAFERTINGVWRTDQGLGTVAIQSHMAELPRLVFLWIISHILPLNALRYTSILLPLMIGPLGVYALIRSLFRVEMQHRQQIAFFGGLTYLANLGTVQHFVVPLEMFALHYGFLPWVIFSAFQFLEHGKRKIFFLFIIATIGMIGQAHTATLFYAFFIGFILMMISAIIIERKKHIFIRSFMLLITILCLNAYWLLPNLYAIRTHGEEVRTSKINRLFSPEAFAKNQLYGNPVDVAIVKNFLFDWKLYDYTEEKMIDVLGPWKEHIKHPLILAIGYGICSIAFIGVGSVILKRHKHGLFLLPMTGFAYIMLLNGTWPMTILFDGFEAISGTLKEALRFPFTKFSILYMLGLSVYFAFGMEVFLNSLHRIRWATHISILLISVCFFIYFLPAFQGNLVSPSMRIKIPQEYFELFRWFNDQPKTDRVAILPIHSFWGWVYYDWGYQGAGFLQFGIPQPILDRDHDRWSAFNEQYQREMQYAIYSQNSANFQNVLNKYNVRYILLDKSVVSVGENKNVTLSWLLPQLLSSILDIREVARFGKNIVVYENLHAHISPTILTTTLPDSGPALTGAPYDEIFATNGLYKTDRIIDFSSNINAHQKDGRYAAITHGKLIASFSSHSQLSTQKKCGNETTQADRIQDKEVIRYISTDGPLCDHFSFPTLDHETSYVLEITSRTIQGFPLQVYICNDLTKHCGQIEHLHSDKQWKTETFYIPKYDDYGFGHTVNINNFAIRNLTTINEITSIKLYEAVDKPFVSTQAQSKILGYGNTTLAVPGRITINVSHHQNQDMIVYYERFHNGWKAYEVNSKLGEIFPFFFGKELNNHVLVSSWANGWKIPEGEGERTIVIFFLPQLLQWFGFILMVFPFFYVAKIGRDNNMPK